ncbi:hypothetical protein NIES3974_43490 [Calothrix sp. NIES-3974]|nr:hypothetical protein NIES3974_43490 [Calothrix sp. NIES-3974]
MAQFLPEKIPNSLFLLPNPYSLLPTNKGMRQLKLITFPVIHLNEIIEEIVNKVYTN